MCAIKFKCHLHGPIRKENETLRNMKLPAAVAKDGVESAVREEEVELGVKE